MPGSDIGKVQLKVAPSIAGILGKTHLKITPSTNDTADERATDWIILEKQIQEGTTIGDLFADLASTYTDFRRAVFDSKTSKVNEQVMVVLNDSLLEFPVTEIKLKTDDIITILLVYAGG